MNTAMEIRKEKRNNLIYEATCFAGSISKVLKPMCAVVIGSVARGDFNDASDVDVVLISDKMPDVYKKRFELIYDYVFGAIEPKGYKIEEFIFHI
ncbi:MAG: nucleotidyltransferase domain-containing protein [Tepidanaerobacteraceae bacterium]|jgi:predicted nucleotidyltransferase|nr:nucleotidyltransferase domain-containing protein [Tepidanaerobacteraceae bacterium]